MASGETARPVPHPGGASAGGVFSEQISRFVTADAAEDFTRLTEKRKFHRRRPQLHEFRRTVVRGFESEPHPGHAERDRGTHTHETWFEIDRQCQFTGRSSESESLVGLQERLKVRMDYPS